MLEAKKNVLQNVLQSPLLCCQATPAAPILLPALFPLLPIPLHWGSPLQMHQFKMACLVSREGTGPALPR